MKNLKLIPVLLFCLLRLTFSQIDDLFKTELPGIGLWQPGSAITTGFDDAYPMVPWMTNFDIMTPEKLKKENNSEGYFYTWVESYCLKAGKRGPVNGAGYLLAPLKGDMTDIIKNILSRRNTHPEIKQEDVQFLLWSIEAGTNFRELDPGLQARVSPLLTPEEILRLNFKTGDVLNLLPDELKEAANYYQDFRQMMLNPQKTFREIEEFAVPVDLSSLLPVDSIYNGEWNYIGKGYYARSFSNIYKTSYFEFYKPAAVNVTRDAKNRINIIKSNNYSAEISYADNPEMISGKYPAEIISKVVVANTEGKIFTINGTGWVVQPGYKYTGNYNASAEFTNALTEEEYIRRSAEANEKLNRLKDYTGKLKSKKKTKQPDEEILSIYQLTEALRVMLNTDRSLSNDVYNNIYDMVNNAEYFFNSKFCGQTESISGQSYSGLFDLFSGLAMVPANTERQRLGFGGYETDPGPGSVGNPNGGPRRPRTTGDPVGNEGNNGNNNNTGSENDTSECRPTPVIKQIDRNYWPAAGSEVIVELEVQNSDNCTIEEVKYTLRDVTSNLGICINDKRVCYNSSLDAYFNSSRNPGLNISSDSMKAEGGNVMQAVVTINDYAAHCMVEVRVKINGTWYTATEEYTGYQMLSIPVDRNFNGIADTWERQYGVEGKPLTWDDDEPIHSNLGDGLTLFEEYRGMFEKLPSGDLQYLRTNPVKKELCVIDDAELLSTYLFERLSDIKVVKLDESTVYGTLAGIGDTIEYRHVNFTSTSYPGVKYAINIIRHDGLSDPNPRNPHPTAYGYCSIGPPKYSYSCYIMPERIRQRMIETEHIVDSALNNSNGELITIVNSRSISRNYSRRFLEKVLNALQNPNKNYLIIDFIINYTTVHEIMHGCSVNHHGRGVEPNTGNKFCVMYYSRDIIYVSFALDLLSIFPEEWFESNEVSNITVNNITQLCGMPGLTGTYPDNCYKQININDRLGR